MFGLDLPSFVQLVFWLVVAVLIGLAILIFKLGKAPPAPAGTWQATVQKGIATRDIHLADDALKQSPLWAELQSIKQHVSALASKAEADAKQAGAAVSAAVSGTGVGSSIEHSIAALLQQINAKTGAAQAVVAVPPAPPGQGIEAYAASIGVDAAAMRLLSQLHPADTWETLADRLKNPARYFTDADHDTVAAAAGPQSATNLNR